ncbi:MAG: STAS domain-containing protein [Candidatus Eisenbacteria bacterium]|uniref:STAS domain-containing protein n=1 Tax=Eiseniibacteriota bacterium TaxID=2212470 RepID=A0A956LY75_UNCEI|nr:STAS domain-containing protein [Candidatus Eisenbacteria bacterium]
MTAWKKLESQRIDHEQPQAVVYRLSGVLTDTKEAFDLLDDLRKAIRDGSPLIVINLEKIDHLTSAGIGVLAAAYTSAKRDGSRICLTNVADRGRSLLELVGLWALIEHRDTEADALTA